MGVTTGKMAFQPNIVTNGLVLNLDAINPNSYPQSGTIWYDTSGNNNNGTLTNGTAWTPNGSQTSFSFDGVDDYVTLGTQTLVTNDFSLNMWFNSTSNVEKEHFIISFGYSSNPSFLITQNTNNNGQCNLQSYYVANGITTGRVITSTFPNTSLINLSFVRQNGVNTAYINGVPQTSTIFTESITFGSLTYVLGWAIPRNKAGSYMQGNIYNCSIYNRALSASEVLQNYNALKTRFGLS